MKVRIFSLVSLMGISNSLNKLLSKVSKYKVRPLIGFIKSCNSPHEIFPISRREKESTPATGAILLFEVFLIGLTIMGVKKLVATAGDTHY